MRWIALGVCSALLGCSPASSEPPSASSTSPILGGAVAEGDPAVVGLVVRSIACTGDRPPSTCTGALIAPRVVLTAAHCLRARRPGELRVLFGRDRASGALIDVDDGVVHPQYDPTTQRFDVALLRLARPAEQEPFVVETRGLDATFEGASVRLVGFGLDETGASGVKRAGTARVSTLEAETFRYAPGPAMTCGGDSGGPVLADLGMGERLVGVTRSGDEGCKEYGTAWRLDTVWATFVEPYLRTAASAGVTPLYERGVDECATVCSADADCPAVLRCLADRASGARRCGLPSLLTGRFGGGCSPGDACGAGTCVETGDSCRCFEPCASAAAAAQPALVAGGGGCVASSIRRSPAPFGIMWLIAIVLAARQFRNRTFKV